MHMYAPYTVSYNYVKSTSSLALSPNSITSILHKACLKTGIRPGLSRKERYQVLSRPSQTWF